MSQFYRMSGDALADVVAACCGDDFAVYRAVTVNGMRIDALALSAEYGVVAVSYVFANEPKPLKAAQFFSWCDHLKQTISVPTLINVCVSKTDEANTDNVLKCITVFDGPSSKNYFDAAQKFDRHGRFCFCQLEEFESCLNEIVGSLRVQKMGAAKRATIGWVVRKLRHWVSDDASDIPGLNLNLNTKQRRIVCDDIKNTTDLGSLPRYRRIRGSAGSGKTIVLVERAARLLSQGKSVCCLTFNKTAAVYLMDLLSASLKVKGMTLHCVSDRLRVQTFHGWCSSICSCPLNSRGGADFDRWPSEVMRSLNGLPDYERYDAVIIDEGQDWDGKWWDIVARIVEPRGEVLMAADVTQNLYGRATEDEKKWCGSHFKGRWISLDGSYRVSPDLIEPLRTFGRLFLKGEPDLPTPRQDVLPGMSKTERIWIQMPDMEQLPEIDRNSLVAEVVISQFRRLIAPTGDGRQSVAVKDVACLAEKADMCQAIAEDLAEVGYEVCSSVDDKDCFHLYADAVKVSTVKSFKGLESPTVIAVLEKIQEAKGSGFRYRVDHAAEAYVAMSRVRASLNSCLCVVCLEPKYREYGRTWAEQGGSFFDCSDWQFDDVLLRESSPDAQSDDPDCVNIPAPLLSLIHSFDSQKSNGKSAVLDVNSNALNTASQNIEYLHTYFFRSYAENYQIFTRTFENPAIRRHFQQKKDIRILAYGCGTGGDLMGTLAALHESGISGKVIQVVAVDINMDALKKCQYLIQHAANSLGNRIEVGIVPHDVTHNFRSGNYPLDFGLDRLGSEKFDIIQSSKMFNEIVSNNLRVYRAFLDQLVKSGLADDGLALLLDVSVSREVTSKGRIGREWVARILSAQTAMFLKANENFELLMPVPCGQCAKRLSECYTSKIFSYRLTASGNAMKSVVCFRLLAKSSTYRNASTLAGRKMDYITLYRKSGSTESCPGFGSPRVDGYRVMDGA